MRSGVRKRAVCAENSLGWISSRCVSSICLAESSLNHFVRLAFVHFDQLCKDGNVAPNSRRSGSDIDLRRARLIGP